MKKLLITVTACAIAYFSISQDNTLPPTGNVGVGTLSPTARLDVNGNVKIDSSLVIKDSLRVNKTIRVMEKVFIGGKTVMSDDAIVKQNFKVNGNANFDGNTNIDGALRIPNTDALSNNNITNGNFEFLLLNENGVAKKGSYDGILEKFGHDIYDPTKKQCIEGPILNPTWSHGTNKIFVSCPQVFVGINTEQPRSSLDVRGTTYTNNLAIGINPTQMEGRFHLKHANSSPNSKILTIENNTRKLLTLDNSGLLKAREIKVDAQAWPDYVFKADYRLMPLSEVETYIQKEGHLPVFPSAQEIEEEGMSVYETNKILVQKIEEITLYLIEQEKEIKKQAQRIEELEKQ